MGGVLTNERETLHVMDDQRRIALVETETMSGGMPVMRIHTSRGSCRTYAVV